jgi:hypothetical protein
MPEINGETALWNTFLGHWRNKSGDAHAGGRTRVPFKPRHAALTVNLAGSMALFLIETWQARNEGMQNN